jgi:uncharacterized protein
MVDMKKSVVHPTEESSAKVFPVNIEDIRIKGSLGDRLRINRDVSIPSLYRNFLKHGTVDNFKIAAGEKKGEITRRLATDSDLYKWMEAVSYDLQHEYTKEKVKILETLISLIGKTQEKSGYINTFYTGKYRKDRLKNIESSHELYCGGHLIQSAIAHCRATGKDNFLIIAVKWADFICKTFGKGRIEKQDIHPEVEMALVELYRITGIEKYLNLAEFFMSLPYKMLSGLPFLKFPETTGHAVKMMYLCSGAADYYIETGDKKYLKKLLALWEDTANRKVYITGGIGSRFMFEAVGLPYELPNLRAYAESCAAVGLMMWNYRMFLITGQARFMDLFETTLYNGFLSSVSLDGRRYFYRNPVASMGCIKRSEWHECTCCPPNIQRMLASLPGYFYGVNKEGIWVSLYGESEGSLRLFSGSRVRVVQNTDYPREGRVSIDISPEKPEEFSLFLRIPEWADGCVIKFNGKKIIPETGKYFVLRHMWGRGKNRVVMDFGMKPDLYRAHPDIESTKGSVAIKRGPVLYCLEGIDNPDINLFNCRVGKVKMRERLEPEMLGGVYTISGEVESADSSTLPLYEKKNGYPDIRYKKKRFKAIPYHTWANRGRSQMVVWLSE